MNIFLTFDYELFFGETTGSVEGCMIDPTNNLLAISKKYSIPMTFFVDVGYLIRLEAESVKHLKLKSDLSKVKIQIQDMIENGCDVQLHIHPHWERAYYTGEKWVMDMNGCYKLDDFHQDEVEDIVTRYKAYLDNLTGKVSHTFRAGGWCIQPFDRLRNLFKKVGIKYDTSVFPGGHFESKHYFFDFRKAPFKANYRFEEDVCVENEDGFFHEYPISSLKYSPLFYWRLYILGRMFPRSHKMVGDGIFLSQPGRKKSVLTNFTWNHVSTDGYYSSKLETSLRSFQLKNFTDMVTIGHPKSNTNYSISVLESFVRKNHKTHTFTSFNDLE